MKTIEEGTQISVEGNVITRSSELPESLKKDSRFSFFFTFNGIPDGENLCNVITGQIDNHLGGSYDYEYKIFTDDEEVILY